MSQTTIEEIMTAVRRLPEQDRRKLTEILAREREAEARLEETPAPTHETTKPHALDQIPPTRDAEMRWLLEYQDF